MNEKSSFIRATRIGGHAYRYLTTRPRTGRVASSFSGGINLLFEGGKAFVPVQTKNVPLHPWAIEIPGEPLRFAEGTPASVKSGVLSVEDTRIVLSNAQIEELQLPHFSATDAAIAVRNFPILAHFVEEARRTHLPNPFQEQINEILRRWHESNDPGVLINLIGLGAGSTPSGDDVLVGMLTGMSVFEQPDDQTRETLTHLRIEIQETVSIRTPLPSAQMLLTACDLSFPEPILALLRGLISEDISKNRLLKTAERVAQLGHHSGIALLSGLAVILDPSHLTTSTPSAYSSSSCDISRVIPRKILRIT